MVSWVWYYNLFGALSGKQALKMIEKRKIDLILLDIVMPDMDGYTLCSTLKANKETQDIPILFITSSTDETSIVKAYNIGAVDYVTKPFKSVELMARVKIHLQLRSTIQKLEYMAYFDVLTNIYNRRRFFELASKKFEESKEGLYGIMLDIDYFKKINDTYGHATGDQVLQAVASAIEATLSDEMLFGRIGGEEFAILLNATHDHEVLELIETIRQQIQAIRIDTPSAIVKCTISSGTSKYCSQTKSLDQLLNSADQALYQAKAAGRNRAICRV